MNVLLRPFVLAAALLTTGLIAGFFYAYACSVTLGTARLGDAEYIATMQAINATVRNPIFALSFFGALVMLVTAALVELRHGLTLRAILVVLALVAYALGGFGLTATINVPLNQALAQVSLDQSASALSLARQAYEPGWNTWNTVRTAFSMLAFLLLVAAVLAPPLKLTVRPSLSS